MVALVSADDVRSLPRGPRGALWQLARYAMNPSGYVARMEARFGTPFTVPTPYGPVVVVGSPEHARELLTCTQESLTGFASESAEVFFGPRSLMLIGGEAHKRERKVLAPLFATTRMRGYAARIADITARHLAPLRTGERFFAGELAQRISLSIIVEVLFGVEEPARLAAFERAILEVVHTVRPALFFFQPLRRSFFGHGPWARFVRARAAVDRLLFEEIARRRTRATEGPDVLSGMLRARYDDGSAMDDATVRDQLITLLVAGHETTGLALAWGLARLHRAPRALARVHDELDAIGPDAAIEAPAPYLEAVCQETLRLDPVVPEFLRQLLVPMRLFGHDLPAGTGIAVSAARIHRRPEIFEEPGSFLPERFLGRSYAASEYLPFGGGAFRCLGAAFALLEMRVILATLLRTRTLAMISDAPLRAGRRNFVVGPAGDVPMRLVR
jgi:cytochrome P450